MFAAGSNLGQIDRYDLALVNVPPASYTAVIRQDGPWWIGWVEEVPGVNAQESSREELLESLRDVLREAL